MAGVSGSPPPDDSRFNPQAGTPDASPVHKKVPDGKKPLGAGDPVHDAYLDAKHVPTELSTNFAEPVQTRRDRIHKNLVSVDSNLSRHRTPLISALGKILTLPPPNPHPDEASAFLWGTANEARVLKLDPGTTVIQRLQIALRDVSENIEIGVESAVATEKAVGLLKLISDLFPEQVPLIFEGYELAPNSKVYDVASNEADVTLDALIRASMEGDSRAARQDTADEAFMAPIETRREIKRSFVRDNVKRALDNLLAKKEQLSTARAKELAGHGDPKAEAERQIDWATSVLNDCHYQLVDDAGQQAIKQTFGAFDAILNRLPKQAADIFEGYQPKPDSIDVYDFTHEGTSGDYEEIEARISAALRPAEPPPA